MDFQHTLRTVNAQAKGNLAFKRMSDIEAKMGMPIYAIAEDLLGIKVKHRTTAEDATEEQKAADQAAAVAELSASIDAAIKRFSVEKASRFVCACADISKEDYEGLLMNQAGPLYRACVTMFMDAFAVFNGQELKADEGDGGTAGKGPAGEPSAA